MARNWWTERKLRLGLRLYSDSQKTLNAMRGSLPEEVQHYVRDLLKQKTRVAIEDRRTENIWGFIRKEGHKVKGRIGLVKCS